MSDDRPNRISPRGWRLTLGSAIAVMALMGCSSSDSGSNADAGPDNSAPDAEEPADAQPTDDQPDEAQPGEVSDDSDCGDTPGCDRTGDTAREGSSGDPDAATLAAVDVILATCTAISDGYLVTAQLAGPGEPLARSADVKWYQLIVEADSWNADARWKPGYEDPGYETRFFINNSLNLESTLTAEWTSPDRVELTLTSATGAVSPVDQLGVTILYRNEDATISLFDDARTECS